MEMNELPDWIQELWNQNPSLARKAESQLSAEGFLN